MATALGTGGGGFPIAEAARNAVPYEAFRSALAVAVAPPAGTFA
jgi:hypothetical protein